MNIVITGASRGIGFETALELSRDPKNSIIALARTKSKLDALKTKSQELYGHANIHPLEWDLNSIKDFSLLYTEIKKHHKTIDILINNAGGLISKPFEKLTDADWENMFRINVLGPVKLIRLLLPYMSGSERSHIVNIGSIGGFQGSSKFAGLSAYSSSKAMLANVTECLAEEFKNKNIFVNCLALGAVQTEMLNEAFPGYIAPLKPETMAKYIADFSLHAHKFINGKIIPVSLSTP